jgi:mannosyltransferase OCH1-like enzyme
MDILELDKELKSKNGKIIHQVWFGTIPNKREAKKAYEKLKLYRDSWTTKNPDWFRVEWNKKMCDDLMKTFFKESYDTYRKYKYEIQRCDMVRYFILYLYSGFYIDMDYYCNRPLSEVQENFKNDIYFVQSPNGTYFQDDDHVSNSFMYSVSGHPFWKEVFKGLEEYKNMPYYYSKHLQVMFTSGPGFLNRIYSKNKIRYKVKSLPWKLFHPYGIKDDVKTLNLDKSIYCAHISKGSWSGKDTFILNTISRDWTIIVFIIGIFILMLSLNYYLHKRNEISIYKDMQFCS